MGSTLVRKLFSALLLLAIASAPLQAQQDHFPTAQSTDETPFRMAPGPGVIGDSVCRLHMSIFASDHTGGVAYFEFGVTTRRIGDGAMTVLSTTLVSQKSLAATTWTAVPIATDNEIDATVSGGVAQTVDWLMDTTEAFCMTGPFGG